MAGGRKRAHVKIEVDDAGDDEVAKATTPKAAAAKTKKKTPPFSPPEDWRDVLAAIKRQRAVGGAPVDTMGCEKISEDAAADDRGRRFVTLVSAMLSSVPAVCSTPPGPWCTAAAAPTRWNRLPRPWRKWAWSR